MKRQPVLILLVLTILSCVLILLGSFLHLNQNTASTQTLIVGLGISIPISLGLIFHALFTRQDNALIFSLLILLLPTIGGIAYLYYLLKEKKLQSILD